MATPCREDSGAGATSILGSSPPCPEGPVQDVVNAPWRLHDVATRASVTFTYRNRWPAPYAVALGPSSCVQAIRSHTGGPPTTEASTEPGASPAESRTRRQVLSDAASELGPDQPDFADPLDRAVATLD